MTNVACIIVGQGISGTLLSYFLTQQNVEHIVINQPQANAASQIAAGVINPVSGRRFAEAWMTETLFPFALDTYEKLCKRLDTPLVKTTEILDFFPSPFMQDSFLKRIQEGNIYLTQEDDKNYQENFQYAFGIGKIKPVYIVPMQHIIKNWKNYIAANNILLEEALAFDQLKITENSIIYKHIKAEKIIFCDGSLGSDNLWFKKLPFAPNKGEALLVEIKNLDASFIYKQGLSLIPLFSNNLFWLGSNYLWNFTNDSPSPEFKKQGELFLQNFLKLPYTVINHLAGVRPATLERRPFVGFHPVYKNVGILNGFGTKGCSLAPFFSYQLVQNMVNNQPIFPEADIKRFEKVLQR